MAAYFVFLVILGTIVYGMEEPSIGGEIRKKRSDGLVHDVVRQMVAEHIERMKIMKVFRQMKNEFQNIKRELNERKKLMNGAKFLQKKVLRKIKDVKEEVTEKSMAEIKKAIKGYDKKVKAVTKRMKKNMKSQEKSIKSVISDTKKDVYNIQKSLIDLRNTPGYIRKEVAFTATLNINMVTSSAIKFQSVITNVGGGYNRSDGIFYCPEAGLYLFSATLMALKQRYVSGYIMKNNIDILWIIEDMLTIKPFPSATGTVLLKLTVGDKVWVRGTGIKYVLKACSFAGTLIQ